MIKLGLENLFAVNTFSNISLHDALKQNAGNRKCYNQTVDILAKFMDLVT